MDVFDLVAKIRLDSSEYESGVGKAKGTFSTLASGVKTGLATVTKVSAAAVSAGVAGVAALTKMGVDGFKQYEQLAGGAELMWGKAYDFIADRASAAYKNVQRSQNDYLQQVNGFAVGLKVALGGNEQAAAVLADRIITAEADIVAATGNTQENVENAFNGIMKSNFSMVDNLGLGITATKEGFQTMMDSVNEYNAAHGKSTKYQIDNVADCQAALLDYIEMQGMAEYASMEAAGTIEGSLAMTKAAWQNLVVGMADENANMGVLIDNFVESAATAAENLLPRIEQTMKGIGQLITKLSPVIAEALPVLVASVLPSLLSAGVDLTVAIVEGVVTALPALYEALKQGVKTILTEVFGVTEEELSGFESAVSGAIDKLKAAYESLCGFIDKVVSGFESAVEWGREHETALTLIAVAVGTLTAAIVAYNVAQAIKNAGGIVELAQLAGLAVGLAGLTVAETAHTVATTVATAATTAFGAVLSFITSPITLVVVAIGALIAIGVLLYKNWDEITAAAADLWAKVTEWFGKIKDAVVGWSNDTIASIKEWAGNVAKWFGDMKEKASEKLNQMKQKAAEHFNAIKDTTKKVMTAAKETVDEKLTAMKSAYDKHGGGIKGIAAAAIEGVKGYYTAGYTFIDKLTGGKLSEIAGKFKSGMENAKTAVFEKLGSIKDKFASIFDNAKDIVRKAVQALKDALNFNWSLPKLKLPRITVKGGEAPYGIGGKGSLPKFSIEWFNKAYSRAMVLSSPTIFGYSNGNFLGGGDGNGNEIVAGESHLMGLIGKVVESKLAAQNTQIVALLAAILDATTDGNDELLNALRAGQVIQLDGREFGRAVRNYA